MQGRVGQPFCIVGSSRQSVWLACLRVKSPLRTVYQAGRAADEGVPEGVGRGNPRWCWDCGDGACYQEGKDF